MSQSTTTHRVTVRPHSEEGMPVVSTQASTLTDHQLLRLCTHYGTQAKLWKQKFLGLLPEVDRRKLYLTQGCSSLFEFATKVGGVSKEQAKVVLSLHNRFEAIPMLKQALVSGEISVNKLARVVSVATPENQEFFLNQATHLSKSALETLVRDVKRLPGQNKKPNKTEKVEQFDDLGLSPVIRDRLLSLRNKGIDINQMLGDFLNQREEKIQQQKQKLAEAEPNQKGASHQKPSRYIPTKVRQLLKQEYGNKCAQETCINRAANIHHTRRFGLNPSHNPLFLAPLCAQHHEIAHAVDVKLTEGRRRLEYRENFSPI